MAQPFIPVSMWCFEEMRSTWNTIFEIGAGRDPGRIKLTFEGIDDMRIDRNGDLVLAAGAH